MGHFVIDGFDFGVDAKRSSIIIKDGVVDFRLVGDETVMADLLTHENHPWDWLIQPPFLYIIGLPCRIAANGDLEHEITEQELDDYDIALYIMEHSDVFPCHLSKKGALVTVAGMVHGIKKHPLKFRSEFRVA